MKLSIIIILCCLIYSANGQQPKTLPSTLMTNGRDGISLSTGTVIKGTFWVDSATAIYDTIPVIVLYQDTAHYIYDGFTLEACLDSIRKKSAFINCRHVVKTNEGRGNQFYAPRFMAGYEVREVHPNQCCDVSGLNAAYFTRYQHITYLDADKKPISKNIIVWQTHPL